MALFVSLSVRPGHRPSTPFTLVWGGGSLCNDDLFDGRTFHCTVSSMVEPDTSARVWHKLEDENYEPHTGILNSLFQDSHPLVEHLFRQILGITNHRLSTKNIRRSSSTRKHSTQWGQRQTRRHPPAVWREKNKIVALVLHTHIHDYPRSQTVIPCALPQA